MASVAIKDFKIKESYFNLINKKLTSYLWEMIYAPMFKIASIKLNKARNDFNPITEALNRGDIYYADGGFRARTKFSSSQTKILKQWGAKYSKWEKAYLIPYDKIPSDILVALSNNKIMNQMKVNQINAFLGDIEKNLPHIIDTMLFHNEVITVLDDTGREVKKNMKRVNIIPAELTYEQKQEMAESYTNNMQYYIETWAQERIPKMRQRVQEIALQGYRYDKVQKMLESEFGIAADKAKFLARNETNIMLAEYKKVTYTKEGFDAFIWVTKMDGRERELHKQLNGTVWYFNNPPVIDERTGKTGLPGQTYNCRCSMIPIMSKTSMQFNMQLYDFSESKKRIDNYLAKAA